MYAIIKTGGKQYVVSEGDILNIERLKQSKGTRIQFNNVLLVANDGDVKVGTPTVQGASVQATIINEGKEKKIIVYKYKRRKRYRRKYGHRQLYSQVRIDKIIA